MSKTDNWVCLPCRKRRSIPATAPHLTHNPPSCPSCTSPMHNIGAKLPVPPSSDLRAWDQFYNQITSPGYSWHGNYCASIDPAHFQENRHWEECLLRRRGGRCEKCAEVAGRIPQNELEKWAPGGFFEVQYKDSSSLFRIEQREERGLEGV